MCFFFFFFGSLKMLVFYGRQTEFLATELVRVDLVVLILRTVNFRIFQNSVPRMTSPLTET